MQREWGRRSLRCSTTTAQKITYKYRKQSVWYKIRLEFKVYTNSVLVLLLTRAKLHCVFYCQELSTVPRMCNLWINFHVKKRKKKRTLTRLGRLCRILERDAHTLCISSMASERLWQISISFFSFCPVQLCALHRNEVKVGTR